jgi:hypothetical protein
MTTLSVFVTWEEHEAALRSYMGIPAPEDAENLQLWLEAGAEMGDAFMDNPFQADDGSELDPPKNTVIGVYAYVKASYDWNSRDTGMTEKKTAALTEKFTSPGNAESAKAALQFALAAAYQYWFPWVTDLTLAGAL